jgi:hypothetical protein
MRSKASFHHEVRDAAALEHAFRLVEAPVDAEVDAALAVLLLGRDRLANERGAARAHVPCCPWSRR